MDRALARAGFVALAVSFVLGLSAPNAFGKGASWVEVQGPGLTKPLLITPDSGTSDQLWPMMIDSGFWNEVCHRPRCQQLSVLSKPPSEDLGLRYTLTYGMNLEPTPHQVVQYVFPFAQPRPVTYMPSGQSYLAGSKTDGGWYVARPAFGRVWSALGLPATVAEAMRTPAPPVTTTTARSGSPVPWVVLAVLVGTAATLVLLRIRKPATKSRSIAATSLNVERPPVQQGS